MKDNYKIGRRRFVKNTVLTTTALGVPMVFSNKGYGVANEILVKDVAFRENKRSSKGPGFKCLFNHELLIVTDKEKNSSQYIQSFVEKLDDTDVDAIMCCPTAWRANLFPSDVDQTWKKYSPDQPLSKFPAFDYIMRYLHSGGDPVKDTLEACRKSGKGFFISYRMNDWHHLNDLSWPTHNDFWRDNPQFWFGKSENTYEFNDESRLLNYMHPEVRDHYFSVIQELCVNYNVDGVELDFQRAFKCFKSSEIEAGTQIMTDFLRRIRKMMQDISSERGKNLKLCVRLPHTLEICSEFGFDVKTWDDNGLVDMINVSSSYINSLEIGIEEFQKVTENARIYGEMHFITDNYSTIQGTAARRFTTLETYWATAHNYLFRGADGISLFNFDYVVDPNGWEDPDVENANTPAPSEVRARMAEGLKGITDIDFLKTVSKNYVVNSKFENLQERNDNTVSLIIPDETKEVEVDRAIVRVELKPSLYHESSGRAEGLHRGTLKNIQIAVWFNKQLLVEIQHGSLELFPPLAKNDSYPSMEVLRFFELPLDGIVSGVNEIVIKNMDQDYVSCEFNSLEVALYK